MVPISETESFVVATTLGGTVLFDVRVGNAVVTDVILLVIVSFALDATAPPTELFLLANNLPAMLLHFMSA